VGPEGELARLHGDARSGRPILPDASSAFTTTITQAELFYGEVLGRACEFARIVASRNAAGRPIAQFDAMIAATARSRQAAVATRNTTDFSHSGIPVINPWAA